MGEIPRGKPSTRAQCPGRRAAFRAASPSSWVPFFISEPRLGKIERGQEERLQVSQLQPGDTVGVVLRVSIPDQHSWTKAALCISPRCPLTSQTQLYEQNCKMARGVCRMPGGPSPCGQHHTAQAGAKPEGLFISLGMSSRQRVLRPAHSSGAHSHVSIWAPGSHEDLLSAIGRPLQR